MIFFCTEGKNRSKRCELGDD